MLYSKKKILRKKVRIMKKYLIRFGTILAGFALTITALNVNTACLFVAHQPKLPAGSDKLRKF